MEADLQIWRHFIGRILAGVTVLVQVSDVKHTCIQISFNFQFIEMSTWRHDVIWDQQTSSVCVEDTLSDHQTCPMCVEDTFCFLPRALLSTLNSPTAILYLHISQPDPSTATLTVPLTSPP